MQVSQISFPPSPLLLTKTKYFAIKLTRQNQIISNITYVMDASNYVH
jgi:hypothetical protein